MKYSSKKLNKFTNKKSIKKIYKGGHSIPKIIHLIYIDFGSGKKLEDNIKYLTCYNRYKTLEKLGFEIKLWDDKISQELIDEYGGIFKEYYDDVNNYKYNVKKCDLLRFLILYKYGGIYSDLDIYYLKGIDQIVNNPQFYILEGDNPCISFFGSHAKNYLLLEFAEYMTERYMEIAKTPNLNEYYSKWKLKYILSYLKWYYKKWLNTPELKDNIHENTAMLCNEEINDEYFVETVNKCVENAANTDYKILIFWATGWQKIDYSIKPKNKNNKYHIAGYY
jgi:hypothetical protein